MDALTLLREQAAMTDRLLTQVVADLTAAQALWLPQGATVNPIAAILAHVYFAEDRLAQRQTQGQSIFEVGGWRERLGFDPDAPWSPPGSVDPDALRAYAAAVRANTERLLAGLQPDDLQREIDSPRGRRPLLSGLSLLLVVHKATHTGEIAALLGSQGIRGFPF